MKIEEKEKLSILLDLLKERYESSHNMRDRSTTFTIWILGIGTLAIGGLLTGFSLTCSQKVIAASSTILIGAVCLHFLCSIKKGFNINREIMIRIEKALGCYTPGFFVEESLLPNDYAQKTKGNHFHFNTLYVLIAILLITIILLVFVSPLRVNDKSPITVNMQGPVDVKITK